MKYTVQILTLCFVIFMNNYAFAQSYIERTVEGVSTDTNALNAKKEILEKSLEEVASSVIREIIGDEKFNHSRPIVSKIITNSPRYVPVSSVGELVQVPEGGFKMTTKYKVNLAELNKYLLESGLLYEGDGNPTVLYLIEVVQNNLSYGWWNGTQDPAGISKTLEQSAKQAFKKNGFFLYNVDGFHLSERVPSNLKGKILSTQDAQNVAKLFGAQIVTKGRVTVLDSSVQIEMTALQVTNGREIATVSRTYELNKLSAEKKIREVSDVVWSDLSGQVLDTWQRGVLGSSLLRLTLQGDSYGGLDLKAQESFKKSLQAQIPEIKLIRDRVIAFDHLTYEIETPLAVDALTAKLNNFQFQSNKLQVVGHTEAELTLKWSTK